MKCGETLVNVGPLSVDETERDHSSFRTVRVSSTLARTARNTDCVSCKGQVGTKIKGLTLLNHYFQL